MSHDPRTDFLALVAMYARAYLDHIKTQGEALVYHDAVPETALVQAPILTVWTCLEAARAQLEAGPMRVGHLETMARGFVLEHFKPMADALGLND